MTLFRTIFSSPIAAGFILISLALLYSGGQEIFAIGSYFDDYYFLLRSKSFGLMGNYFAPIKEYLYSVFIALARAASLSLRNFEVFCYGMALLWLWDQTGKLMKSRLVAWIAVIPLAFFTYQHSVFNRATYDALQLILTPLTIASAIQIFLTRASPASLVTAGLIGGLQTLTRPEGFLFLLPQLVALVFVRANAAIDVWSRTSFWRFFRQAALVCLIALGMQQCMSAVNRVYFGFWAPTIMKSSAYQDCLSALMSIKPTDAVVHRYSPVPNSSLERAYEVSPELRKAKPFFEEHINGKGWSSHANPGFRDDDGSIPGGHFQWALLNASAHVAGSDSRAMLTYLKAVSTEIRAALDSGKLEKRFVVSTALGPEFSLVDRHFWASAGKLGTMLLNLREPQLPEAPEVGRSPQVESDFNRLALRRTGLLEKTWQLSGWAVNPTLGMPRTVELDQTALDASVKLTRISRPDVAKVVLGLDSAQAPMPMLGFELSSRTDGAGHMTVAYEGRTTLIPIHELTSFETGKTFIRDGLHVHVDTKKAPRRRAHFAMVERVSAAAYYMMRALLIISPLLLIAVVVLKKKILSDREDRLSLLLVVALALSLVVPRWGLLSAIDSAMYPGDEGRYLAAAAFTLWYLALFTTASLVRRGFRDGYKIKESK